MIIKFTEKEYQDAKSEDLLKLQCEFCGKEYYTKKKLIKHELEHKRGRCKYCSHNCSIEANKVESHKLKCANCGKDIIVLDCNFKNSATKRFFCSNSCSAHYNNKLRGKHNEETKRKISEGLKRYWDGDEGHLRQEEHKEIASRKKTPRVKENKTRRKIRICKICGKEYTSDQAGSTRSFCSKECSEFFKKHRKRFLSEETIERLRAAGRKSAEVQMDVRRSKNEAYFCELCERHFKNVKHNERLFNGWDADVIIEDAKIAVLWNGKWHYQKIKKDHSVQQVQNRDEIKIKEIKRCGYTPYIIKDMGKENSQFVEEQFNIFLNAINDQ